MHSVTRMSNEIRIGIEAGIIQSNQSSHRSKIAVRQLSLSLGGVPLLRDINLDIRGNGITMVLGANGAGKSLLLKCLHGLLKPQGGEIKIDGRPHFETRQQQAMVFQRPVLMRRSVLANVTFAAPENTDSREIADLLNRVHLAEIANVPARLLSGGEQQRLALARALITKPSILFLDEPTASLDPASALIIERLIQDTSLTGVRILFITHDINQAKRLGQDVIFMHRGEITEHTDKNKFFTNAESREAIAYLSGELIL